MKGNLVRKPQLGFSEAVKTACSRLTDFKGRSRRSEFWWTVLAYYIASLIINGICTIVLPHILGAIVSMALPFLMFSLTIRRLHDTGKSGWWVVVSWAASIVLQVYIVMMQAEGILESSDVDELMGFFTNPVYLIAGGISFITGLVIFVFCLLDSKPESNKYGDSPVYMTAEEAFGAEQ